jgi:flagellar protein FlaF
MAVAEIIGAAIGVLLLVVVAYILVGSTLTAGETLANAQKDLTLLNEARLRTDIQLNQSEIDSSSGHLTFSVTNTGNEIISNFKNMDIYTYSTASNEWQYLPYNSLGSSGTWKITRIDNDYVHINELDPGEKMWIDAAYTGNSPNRFQITTNNGVSASAIT